MAENSEHFISPLANVDSWAINLQDWNKLFSYIYQLKYIIQLCVQEMHEIYSWITKPIKVHFLNTKDGSNNKLLQSSLQTKMNHFLHFWKHWECIRDLPMLLIHTHYMLHEIPSFLSQTSVMHVTFLPH